MIVYYAFYYLLGLGSGIWLFLYMLARKDKHDYPFSYRCQQDDCNFITRANDAKLVILMGEDHERKFHNE